MIVGLLGLLLTVFLVFYSTIELEDSLTSTQMQMVGILAKSIETDYRAGEWPFETLEEISKQEDYPSFTWVIDHNGKIVMADNATMWGKQIKDPALGAEKPFAEKRFYPEMNGEMLLIAYPLDIKEQGKHWMLYHGNSLKPIAAAKNKIILSSIGFFLGALCLAFIFSLFLARNITKPILELTKGAKAVAEGNLDYNVKVETHDEFENLASAFNQMTSDLKKSRAQLEKYSKELEKGIKEKTKDLEKEKLKLEKSEKAAYNMMEDLNEANKDLEVEKKSIEQKVRERTVELQKAYEDLKELDKAKEEFISLLSHELKTPIFPIMGYTDMILSGSMGKISGKQKEKLKIIEKNAANLSRLVADMLDMSRLELKKVKLEMDKCELGGLAKEASDSLALLAKNKRVGIKINAKEKVTAFCDKKRILQVIENLVTNAVKFTRVKGKIEIAVSKDKDNAKVSVKDNGIGIPKEKQKELFSRFYQIKTGIAREQGGGVGLGLAISKGIIELHKGRIWCESEKGKGATITFTIPLKTTKSLK